MEEQLTLTADEAASLLADGDYVHNFIQGGFALIGCDYDRADAIKAFRDADRIEFGGAGCRGAGHPLAVTKGDRVSFFAADMAKVEAFEEARSNPVHQIEGGEG